MAVTREYKEGTIVEFFDADTGILNEKITGGRKDRDFFHPGAQIDFKKGEVIMFLKITLPNDKVIVKEIQKKNS